MGYRGLALGTALAAMFNAGTLLWLLRGRLHGIEGARVATALAKILGASALMGLAAHATVVWTTIVWPGSMLAVKAVRVFAAIGAGVLALVAAARLLRIAEFDEAFSRVIRRLKPA
jgi:peptidoglycan biosynthesis protein MviN/MurJ (putative lipid II flippase)